METLFVLKKKFYSGRVIRKIYEYLDTRKYWLKQYRYVINNGFSKYYEYIEKTMKVCIASGKSRIVSLLKDINEQSGVKTFRLLVPGIPEGRLYRYSGLHYYMYEEREQWINDKKVLRVPPRYAYNFYADWEKRCGAERSRSMNLFLA